LGLLTACGFAGFVVASCGSSSSGGDNGTITHKDAGMGAIVDAQSQMEAEASVPADGTSGVQCKTDADCTPDGGPGINKCSNTQVVSVAGARAQLYPTPVCMVPLAVGCDPAPPSDPSGMSIHFCDGPDDPSAPGICVPATTPPTPGQGSCFPKCTLPVDGSAQMGCVGKNTCTPVGACLLDAQTLSVCTTSLGYCQGTCLQDSDCTTLGTGWVCQVDVGFCVQRKLTRRKTVGQACTSADSTSNACNCLVNSTTNTGFCTSSCVVGGSVDTCPAGWACENQEPPQLPDGTNLPAENPGTQGFCVPVCTDTDGGAAEAGQLPSDAASDGSAEGGPVPDAATPLGCPTNSSCQTLSPNGPECWP
jgi:hypothetical protein